MLESPSTDSSAMEKNPGALPTSVAHSGQAGEVDRRPWGLMSPPGTRLGCYAWQEK